MIMQSLPLAFLLGDATPMELFIKGEWIMWPMILVSFVMITVVVERLIFIFREKSARKPELVKKMLESVERGDADGAIAMGKGSSDFVAQIIVESLKHREHSHQRRAHKDSYHPFLPTRHARTSLGRTRRRRADDS